MKEVIENLRTQEEEFKCEKCGKPSEGLHSCPFQEDVNDDHDKKFCNCCDECMEVCLAEI